MESTEAPFDPADNVTSRPVSPSCLLYNFIMYAIIIGLICMFGFVGNVIAFVVFCRDKIKTSTSFLFQGLSVIDFLLLLIVFPLYSLTTFVEYTEICQEGETLSWKIYLLPCAFIFQTATIWVTVLVGFNRYIAVCHPFKAARLCTVFQARCQLGIVLLFSVLYTAPKFAEVPTSLGDSELYNIVYNNIMYTIFLLLLPLFGLAILNIRLVKALKELRHKRAKMQSLRQQQDNNVTFVLIIVVIVFIICQSPALVNQILWTLLPETYRDCGGFQFYFRRFSNMLVVANSAVNFPIYVVFNTRFRQVLKETFAGIPGINGIGGVAGGGGGGLGVDNRNMYDAVPGQSNYEKPGLLVEAVEIAKSEEILIDDKPTTLL